MPRKNSQFQISWITISYRSVASALAIGVICVYAVLYFMFPNSAPVRFVSDLTDRVIAMIDGSNKPKAIAPGAQQAHFTMIDGMVKVKKGSSNAWISAAYDVPLERGDVVQTGPQGMAKLAFLDGTNYTVKQDSLIVIEENSANSDLQTNVSVQVTSGNVDLSTSTFTAGSRSSVVVAGASATLSPESSAAVHNDPRKDEHQILVKKGSGTVQRGDQTVALGSYEAVSFKVDSAKMVKTKELTPPYLIAPANMAPVYTAGAPVGFEWTPVTGSHGYRVQVATNPQFTSLVYDKVVPGSQVKVPSLKEGNYYWTVTTIDISGRQSPESEHNQFAVFAKKPEQASIALDLMPFLHHGHLVEVRGKTDVNARILVNGQEVPLIKSDGTFSYLTPPLSSGEHEITVTAQTPNGAVRTEKRNVVVE